MSLVFKEINTKGLKGHDVWNLFASSSGRKKSPVSYMLQLVNTDALRVFIAILSAFSVSLLFFQNQEWMNNLQGKKYIFKYGSNNNNKLIH